MLHYVVQASIFEINTASLERARRSPSLYIFVESYWEHIWDTVCVSVWSETIKLRFWILPIYSALFSAELQICAIVFILYVYNKHLLFRIICARDRPPEIWNLFRLAEYLSTINIYHICSSINCIARTIFLYYVQFIWNILYMLLLHLLGKCILV